MRKIKSFLLACVILISTLSMNMAAALPGTAQPLWDNTVDVVIGHTRIGTTSHVNIDITIDKGATIKNAVVRLIAMEESPSTVVKTWTDPEWTVNLLNTHNFYDTYSPVTAGKIYRLSLQCEVWRNGVKDEISLYKDVQY